jgi:hypothetical protein
MTHLDFVFAVVIASSSSIVLVAMLYVILRSRN